MTNEEINLAVALIAGWTQSVSVGERLYKVK